MRDDPEYDWHHGSREANEDFAKSPNAWRYWLDVAQRIIKLGPDELQDRNDIEYWKGYVSFMPLAKDTQEDPITSKKHQGLTDMSSYKQQTEDNS